MSCSDQVPFGFHLLHAGEKKLPEAAAVFDLAERGFGHCFAASVFDSPFLRSQFASHLFLHAQPRWNASGRSGSDSFVMLCRTNIHRSLVLNAFELRGLIIQLLADFVPDRRHWLSRRFYQIASPSQSQHRIFSRSRARLRNRNNGSLSGSCDNTCRTMPLSPSKLRRMSVGWVQTEICIGIVARIITELLDDARGRAWRLKKLQRSGLLPEECQAHDAPSDLHWEPERLPHMADQSRRQAKCGRSTELTRAGRHRPLSSPTTFLRHAISCPGPAFRGQLLTPSIQRVQRDADPVAKFRHTQLRLSLLADPRRPLLG